MKTFEINKNSWHYRLANTYSNFDPQNKWHQNLCSYIRRVFFGGILAIVIAAVSGFMVASLVCWIGALILWPFIGFFEMMTIMIPGAIIVMFISSICLVAGLHWVKETYDDYKRYKAPRYEPVLKEPGFVTLAWRSFKEKTCVKITVK